MMAQKHLHELLKEDQEPFHLKNYIADRRCQLNKSSTKTHLQINKRKPFSQNSNFTSDFCKKACFLSFHDSPDLRKSPLFQAKTPTNNNKNTIFLREAALGIQSHRSSSKNKPRSKNGNAFGLFGSILKRLTHRNRNPKPETENVISEEKNEENSMDLAASCSCNEPEDFASFDRQFSQSPFRFVLKTNSPSRHEREDKENYELESLKRLQVEEEEEEKEQSSPVSILDRPFEDDDNDDDDNGIDHFDLECSYAIVQRAKQQLLHNLRRFEKLVELDPTELEKRMVEKEQDDADDSFSSQCEMNIPGYNPKHTQDGMKRLVSDLIVEEETSQHNRCVDEQAMAERVSTRLESWKDVESNTIDMMVEQDFGRDQIEGWKGNEEHIRETGIEVEFAIFGLLMQEMIEELGFFNPG